jgi:hypothetical protein
MNDEENGGVDVLPTVKENNDGFQDNESKTFSNFASLPHGLPQSITASGKVAASDIGEEEGKEIKAAKDEKVFRAPVNSQLSPTEEKKKLVRSKSCRNDFSHGFQVSPMYFVDQLFQWDLLLRLQLVCNFLSA